MSEKWLRKNTSDAHTLLDISKPGWLLHHKFDYFMIKCCNYIFWCTHYDSNCLSLPVEWLQSSNTDFYQLFCDAFSRNKADSSRDGDKWHNSLGKQQVIPTHTHSLLAFDMQMLWWAPSRERPSVFPKRVLFPKIKASGTFLRLRNGINHIFWVFIVHLKSLQETHINSHVPGTDFVHHSSASGSFPPSPKEWMCLLSTCVHQRKLKNRTKSPLMIWYSTRPRCSFLFGFRTREIAYC